MAKKSDKKKTFVGALPLEMISPGANDDQSDRVSVLMFDIGEKVFAIGVENTEGVVDCPHISPLPSAPDGILGVASVHGRMTLVMDLSLGGTLTGQKQRLILLKGESQLGLLADQVEGVMALEPKRLRPEPARKTHSANQSREQRETHWSARAYFQSNKRQVPLIDVERLVEQ